MNKEWFTNPIEQKKRNELLALFDAWKELIKTKPKIYFTDHGKEYNAIDYFNTDGFFPGYFSFTPKILFIGRESRDCSGCDRMDVDFDDWLKNSNGNYWRRIFFLLYGIRKQGKALFNDIPEAREILKEMIKTNCFGFALMNISKYSNDSDNGGTANFPLINQFLKDSELDRRNFIREEIELLEPDIIITANLWDGNINEKYLQLVFPEEDMSAPMFDKEKNVCLRDFRLGGRIIKRIDTFHFSARKNDKKHFYDPVMKLLFN